MAYPEKSIFIKGTLFMSSSIRIGSVAILDSKFLKYFEGLETTGLERFRQL